MPRAHALVSGAGPGAAPGRGRGRSRPPAERSADRDDAWIVGGAVRDALLGGEVRDIDLAVAPGAERDAARAIADTVGGFAFPLSEEHATWRAVAQDESWHVDVTALRGDSIEADLGARDFTVNAVAVPLGGGEPIDPAGGLADAQEALLRAASPQAFSDDPLRLLRLVRLAAGYGFRVQPDTAELARAGRRARPSPPASASSPSCARSSPGPTRCAG